MKQKINRYLALIAILAVLATTIGIMLVYYNIFQRQVRRNLRIDAELLSDTGMFQQVHTEAGDQIPTLSPSMFQQLSQDNLRITWINADGTVLYDNDMDESKLENHAERPEIKEAFASGSGECIRQSDTLNMNTFYYALRLEDGTVLRVSAEARNLFSVFFTALPLIVLIMIVIVGICVWFSHVLTRQLLAPIEKMAENMEDSSQQPVYKELVPFANKIRSQHENILAAAQSRQDFTANVSHELKTPLTAISGYAELIENHMAEPDQEVYFARQIQGNADRLVSLINDIIRLSELDHQELPRNFEHIDLYETVKECGNSLRVNANNRQIQLSLTGESGTIYADKSLIMELVMNLGQNAIQYSNAGGRVEIGVSKEDETMILTVKDTGIGIPKELQDRVFERFYRVDKSRSRQTGGTGLGLAIVKHIVELHGAAIELDSYPGKGTTVLVRF